MRRGMCFDDEIPLPAPPAPQPQEVRAPRCAWQPSASQGGAAVVYGPNVGVIDGMTCEVQRLAIYRSPIDITSVGDYTYRYDNGEMTIDAEIMITDAAINSCSHGLNGIQAMDRPITLQVAGRVLGVVPTDVSFAHFAVSNVVTMSLRGRVLE